jgi:hypothetical protein
MHPMFRFGADSLVEQSTDEISTQLDMNISSGHAVQVHVKGIIIV